MNGYGEFFWKDGKKYFGYYNNDKKNGFGIFFGLMKNSILDFGKMVFKMVLVNVLKEILLNMVFGKMGKKIFVLIMKMNLNCLMKLRKENLKNFLK